MNKDIKYKSLHIAFLGISNFPYGLAIIEETKLILSSIKCESIFCTVVKGKLYNSFVDKDDIRLEGVYNGINYYFSHKLNALITKDYNIEEYASLMKFVIDNPNIAQNIGLKGKEFGFENFDYKKYGYKIRDFIFR